MLIALLFGLHGVALLALGFVQGSALVLLALAGAVLASAVYLLRRYGWLCHPSSVIEIHWDATGWYLQLYSGRCLKVCPVEQALLGNNLMLLMFRCEDGCHYSIPLWPDSCAPATMDQLRRLRVCLLHN